MPATEPRLQATRQLAIHSADGAVKVVPLIGERLALGRSSANELAYPEDLSLSRQHLVFERREGVWYVRDLGSRNGTFVDKRRITSEHRIEPGEEVTAGALRIEYIDGGPATNNVTFVEQAAVPPNAATIVTDLTGALREGTTLQWKEQRPIQALIRAGQELSSHRPLGELFRLILDLSIEASGAGRGVLMTVEGDALVPQAATGGSFQISNTVRTRVMDQRESVLVVDARMDANLGAAESIVAQRVRSIMAVPLQTGDKVIGLIYLDVVNFLQPFTREDLSLLTVMANIAAIRIEQARLAEVEQAERIYAHELEQAAEIQQGLLPSAPPQVGGIELAGRNIPCRTVGGDYFDYFLYPDGRLALLVGDVAGKGMPAALMMSSLEARIQVLAESGPEPAELVSRLNRSLKAKCPGNRFVTFFFGVFDPGSGALTYCNAGHNPPLLVRAGGSIEELRTGGIVLGLMDMMPYHQATVTLSPGDTLVMFSDGVTEAAKPGIDEEFGEERLGELVRARAGAPLGEVIDSVIGSLREFTAGAPFADDVTLVLARR